MRFFSETTLSLLIAYFIGVPLGYLCLFGLCPVFFLFRLLCAVYRLSLNLCVFVIMTVRLYYVLC